MSELFSATGGVRSRLPEAGVHRRVHPRPKERFACRRWDPKKLRRCALKKRSHTRLLSADFLPTSGLIHAGRRRRPPDATVTAAASSHTADLTPGVPALGEGYLQATVFRERVVGRPTTRPIWPGCTRRFQPALAGRRRAGGWAGGRSITLRKPELEGGVWRDLDPYTGPTSSADGPAAADLHAAQHLQPRRCAEAGSRGSAFKPLVFTRRRSSMATSPFGAPRILGTSPARAIRVRPSNLGGRAVG